MKYLVVLTDGYREEFFAENQRSLLLRLENLLTRRGDMIELVYCYGRY